MPTPEAPPDRSPETPPGPLPARLLPVLLTGVFMAALDTAVIGPALPVLRQDFGLDIRDAGLLTVVFILFSLPGTALLAHLGDRHGRRPVFLGSVVLFALGSLVVALSPDFATLLLGRALQGLGGGGIVPIASALIGDELAPAARARALGLLGAVYGLAFVLGPPLAALLMVLASWQAIFLLNLPLAALIWALGRKALPRRRGQGSAQPLDRAGIVLVFLTLGCAVLGITRSADLLLGRSLWPALLAAAALLLVLLLRVEARAARRGARPLIPLALFRRRQLRLAYLLSAGAGFGMGGVIFLASVATLAHGVAQREGGFVLLPLVLCSMAASMLSGRHLLRLGPRPLVLAGFVLLAVGYGACALPGSGLWGFGLATVPVGLGVGLLVGGALRSIVIDEAPADLRGAAQGLVNVCTSLGTLLAATLIGSVAEFSGGGAPGLALAYGGVALLMALMLPAALALRATPLGRPALGH